MHSETDNNNILGVICRGSACLKRSKLYVVKGFDDQISFMHWSRLGVKSQPEKIINTPRERKKSCNFVHDKSHNSFGPAKFGISNFLKRSTTRESENDCTRAEDKRAVQNGGNETNFFYHINSFARRLVCLFVFFLSCCFFILPSVDDDAQVKRILSLPTRLKNRIQQKRKKSSKKILIQKNFSRCNLPCSFLRFCSFQCRFGYVLLVVFAKKLFFFGY